MNEVFEPRSPSAPRRSCLRGDGPAAPGTRPKPPSPRGASCARSRPSSCCPRRGRRRTPVDARTPAAEGRCHAGRRPPPQTVRVAPSRSATCRSPWTRSAGHPVRDVRPAPRSAGTLMDSVSPRPDGQGGRPSRPDRPEALSGRARSGAGTAREDRRRSPRRRATPSATRPSSSRIPSPSSRFPTSRRWSRRTRRPIQTDQAQVETAQLNLDYTRIVSPIDGREASAGRPRQLSAAVGLRRHRRRHRARSDQRHLPDRRGQPAAHRARLAFGGNPGYRLRPRQRRQARRGEAHDLDSQST